MSNAKIYGSIPQNRGKPAFKHKSLIPKCMFGVKGCFVCGKYHGVK